MHPQLAPTPADLTPADTWWHQCAYCPVLTQGGGYGMVAHLEAVHPEDPPPWDFETRRPGRPVPAAGGLRLIARRPVNPATPRPIRRRRIPVAAAQDPLPFDLT